MSAFLDYELYDRDELRPPVQELMPSNRNPPKLVKNYLQSSQIHHQVRMSNNNSILLVIYGAFIAGDGDKLSFQFHWEHWLFNSIGDHVTLIFYGFVKTFFILKVIEDEDLIFSF